MAGITYTRMKEGRRLVKKNDRPILVLVPDGDEFVVHGYQSDAPDGLGGRLMVCGGLAHTMDVINAVFG